jgi:AraC family transcriptional regulator of adaptative response/methylated-DNA-[protein]-cysteine methyltransferase
MSITFTSDEHIHAIPDAPRNSTSGFRWKGPGQPAYPSCMSLTTLPAPAEMERAFLAKDASYDGVFVTAVKTTGIFCRPSCPARKPLRHNLEFYGTIREALFAGYRPCQRCRPLEADGRPPEWVTKLLAAVDASPEPRLRAPELRALGITPERARRYFQHHYGLSFDAYCRARRLGGSLSQLRAGADLDSAAFDAGYESLSGFREAFSRHFGQPPGRGRQGECAWTAWLQMPLGPMIAAATGQGLCLLEFVDRRMLETQLAIVGRRLKTPLVPGENEHVRQIRRELDEYFAGQRRVFEVPLHVSGTPFQERVWAELARIPYGQTRSYADVARALGTPGAVRAVGHANGMNRIAIVLPCHRVLNANGQLGGYGGGLWRKQRLLALEQGQPVSGLKLE